MISTYEPLNYSVIAIHGQDATAFLQGQVTCDVTKVREDQCQLGACCNVQGRVIALFWIVKTPTQYLLCLPQAVSSTLLATLQKYKLASKVEIEMLPGCVGSVIGITPSQDENTLVAQIPNAANRFLLLSAHAPSSLPVPAFSERWQYQNILAGFPQVYAETISLFTPHELNLIELQAVSFDKGCYKGQEIVARMHYRGKPKQHMYRIEYKSEQKLSPGAPLLNHDQQKIGHIIELCETDSSHVYRGLAVMLDAYADNSIDIPHICLLTI